MLVHFRYTFPSCSPDPNHLTVPGPSRLLKRLLAALPRVPGVRLSLASPTCCDRLAEGVLHPLSVQERLVALYVRDPELVKGCFLELALHQIVRRRGALDALDLARTWNAGNLGVVHQNRHKYSADVDPAALGQLGVHAARPVGAPAVVNGQFLVPAGGQQKSPPFTRSLLLL